MQKIVQAAMNTIKTGERFMLRQAIMEDDRSFYSVGGCGFCRFVNAYHIPIHIECKSNKCKNCYMELATYIVNHYGGVQYEQ